MKEEIYIFDKTRLTQEVKEQLYLLAETSYGEFNAKLLPGIERIIGVRLPLLRKLAKTLVKQDLWKLYLEEMLDQREELFEETMLQGILLGCIPLENMEDRLTYVERFLPKINNWAVCDSTCISMKFARKCPEKVWNFLEKQLESGEEYYIRFCVVMYIDHFINQEYIDRVLEKLNEISHPAYYVKMAVAWAVSMCYVFDKEKGEIFLENCKLDDFTYNKSLQKIIESRQISKEEKDIMRKRKRSSKDTV